MVEVMTALATPFVEDKVDVNSFARLVKNQVDQGADSLLCCGATGEGCLLSACEKKLVVSVAKSLAKNLPVWLGIDGNQTDYVASQVRWAQDLGVDGLMIAPPSFCKCTVKGLLLHIEKIRNATHLPLMLYNAPSRVGYQLPLEVVKEVACWGVTIKDAGVDLDYTKKLKKHATVYCGNELLLKDFTSLGVQKVVSVVSNLTPQLVKEALLGENYQQFEKIAQLTTLEVNPVAIKYMLYKQGIFDGYNLRLPLTKASRKTRKTIDEVKL